MRISGKLLSTVGATVMVAASPALADDYGKTFYAGILVGQQFYNASMHFQNGDDWWSRDSDFTEFGGLVGWRRDIGQSGAFAALELDAVFGNPDFGEIDFLAWTEFHGAGHVRGLVGTTLHDNVSVFASFGLAAAFLEYDGYRDETLLGVTAGVGAEVELHDNFRLRVEGLYDAYGTEQVDNYNGRWSNVTVRAAAIFDFN